MADDIFQEMSLEEIADFRNGKAISPERYSEDGQYPVFGANGQIARSDDVLNAEAVVVIGRVGAYCGSVHYIPEPSWVTDNAIVATARSGNDVRFLYYLFDHLELRRTAIGSAQPLMTQGGLKVVQTVVPPLKVQQAIACILGTLDDKIELNRQLNRTLEDIARAIFKSWFVDFDPVRTKAAGQQPPGLKPEIAVLFPDSFDDSELGEIPRGWINGKINGIAHINTSTLGRRDALDVIDYIEINEVMRGEVGTITRYARGEEPSRARRRLKHGDTVLSTVRPDRGAYFLVLNPLESLIVSTGFAVLTAKDSNWAFLHAATTRPEFGQELGHLADGGAYPAIRPEVIGGRDLLIPNDLRLVAAFDKIAQPLFLRAEVNRIECRALIATRDALLPKLISGDIAIADAERIAARCV